MTRISPNLLNDTLNLIQLARETALASGKTDQAQRLSPLVNEMRGVVSTAREPQAAAPAGPGSITTAAPSTGLMGQSDFRALLDAARSGVKAGATSAVSSANSPAARPLTGAAPLPQAPQAPSMPAYGTSGSAERGQLVTAMARGGMPELDIARQMGMTRDEVKMMLDIFGG